MGTYTTATSLYPLLVGTSQDTATTALLGSCITWAENEVNKKLAKRYDVAAWAASVPPQIASLTEQLAVGWFHLHNGRGSKESMARAEMIFKQPRENLAELAEGIGAIVDDGGSLITPAISTGILSTTDEYTPIFGLDKPTSWKVDPDLLDDTRSERD